MPIEQVSGGYRWGQHGHVYPSAAGAERQEAAARAHGYTGDLMPAAGVLVRAADGTALFLRRSGEGDHAGEWCLPGGGLEFDEGPESAARRELMEETGYRADGEMQSLHRAQDNGVDYTTFTLDVQEAFEPKLNGEHSEAKWAPLTAPPQPLHPGVDALLRRMQQQAQDAAMANDKAMTVKARGERDGIAMDKASVRTFTVDGRMRVEVANISKAIVNPYQGREIPDCEQLGLDPDRIYQLLRDPEELEKAAPSFNGVPLLDTHVPSTAWDHPFGKVVGATGTDAVFEKPYLKNSLVVWTQDAIDGIESGEQRELSCGYRYTADMTPGTYEGERYDGVMRRIVGNHVALVPQGRAGADVLVGDSAVQDEPAKDVLRADASPNPGTGPDVMVGDSQPQKGNGMTKVKAIARKAAALRGAFLVSPKLKALAADAKVTEIVSATTKANWKEQRQKLEAAAKPKLANDADLQDLVTLLDAVEKEEEGMDDDPAAGAGGAAAVVDPAVDAAPGAEILAMLKGKVGDDVLAAIGEKLKGMQPAAADAEEKDKDMVSKSAMDAALAAASKGAEERIKLAADTARKEAEENTIKRLREIDEARDVAQPFVGKLTGAFDSAESVYRAALTALKIEHKDMHPSALRPVLEAQPKPGTSKPSFAADASQAADFDKRWPDAARVKTVG